MNTKGRKLSEVYYQALVCEEGKVMEHFTQVEELVQQIRMPGTVRRALNRAFRRAEKEGFRDGGHECH